MSWFRRNRPPELRRVDAARRSIEQHGDQRPLVMHTLDKVETAIEHALADRAHIATSLTDFDADQIAAELKTALRDKPSPTAPDSPAVVSLRRRHEAVHALHNRAEAIDAGINKALVDLDTLVAQAAMAAVADAASLDDLRHWISVLDADAAALSSARAEVDRVTPDVLEEP